MKLDELQKNLQNGKMEEVLPKDFQAQMDMLTAMVPEADAADQTTFLQVRISQEIKQLKARRAEYAGKQADAEKEAKVWAGKLKAAKTKK